MNVLNWWLAAVGTLIWLGLAIIVIDATRQDAMRVLARIGELRPNKRYWIRATVIVTFVVAWPLLIVDRACGAELIELAREDARARLVELGYPVADLDVSHVRVLEMRERMACNGERALGCFASVDVPLPSGEVRNYGVMAYRRVAPSEGYSYSSLRKVLAHEWTHAFLWALGDPTWDVHDERFRR